MLVDFGRAGWIKKARMQPDKLREAMDKVKTDGLLPTLDSVRNKLDKPIALGYCNVGTVLEVGTGVTHLQPGDRVASNGKHAEIVAVPGNLCAKIPDGVTDEDAAFTVIGAIALQSIRLVAPTLGEAVVVVGLGLVGLMTVQLLKAHGCRVLGIDFDSSKLALAAELGAETFDLSSGGDAVVAGMMFSRGRGVDAVIIAASTKSNDPVHHAARMSRKRGRIVLVGVTGLELSRADFYEKELSFQVSCSYGPGRYDPTYEEGGHDYPFGFVRWTEGRNLEAVLDMMAEARLRVAPLVTHRFDITEAEKAYDVVGGSEPSLGILLTFDAPSGNADLMQRKVTIAGKPTRSKPLVGRASLAFIGAGNYANAVLIPAFRLTGAKLGTVSSRGGVSSFLAGSKFGFDEATTDTDAVLADLSVEALVISTRHANHARLAAQGLRAGKHVFVEKPLATTKADLADVEAAWAESRDRDRPPQLMVGFNRRFSPHVVAIRKLLAARMEPKAFVMTVNAGAIPSNHWTQDGDEGGGRIVGEACHFIDLLRHLAGAEITAVSVNGMASATGDTASISLNFSDGSIGAVHYFANGSKSFPKERLEIFCGGAILTLDNFRRIVTHGWKGAKSNRLLRQDKGQKACAAAFVAAVETGSGSPIPFDELVEVARVTIDAAGRLSS
ncbi:Dehydrogenase-like protein [Mesorhizobium prunaredense]|uniref:Dehydrogenase-like protein n=1 Tax=Mesorhizobium prunaredense TaxID=1631249 RepID=A0A1R3VE30_9HYPH|nr:bi-domain-containing oxidoreductase [Mesorhizobium prunaredense]SIT58131.1 Dehydrogenase-like protein [Mesorhizobium prunaredense]